MSNVQDLLDQAVVEVERKKTVIENEIKSLLQEKKRIEAEKNKALDEREKAIMEKEIAMSQGLNERERILKAKEDSIAKKLADLEVLESRIEANKKWEQELKTKDEELKKALQKANDAENSAKLKVELYEKKVAELTPKKG